MNAYTHLLIGVVIGSLGAASGIIGGYRRATTQRERRLVVGVGLTIFAIVSALLASIV